jgi:hypothetical protein
VHIALFALRRSCGDSRDNALTAGVIIVGATADTVSELAGFDPGQRRSAYKAGAPILNVSGDGWAGLTGTIVMLVLGLLAALRFSFAQIPWAIPAASR